MDDMSSDSSDSEVETTVPTSSDLSLNMVNEMVREFEKMEKRERKKRVDAGVPKNEIVVTPEAISKITLTKKQIKAMKPPVARTPKQMESAMALAARKKEEAAARRAAKEEERRKKIVEERSVIDAREDKSQPGIRLKIAPTRARKPKPPVEPESEEEEIDEPPPVRSYQAKKPSLDLEDDEVEKKVNKLNKLNNVLSSNPFYAQVMASRGVRF